MHNTEGMEPRPAIKTPEAAQGRADIATRFHECLLEACPGLPMDRVTELERQRLGGLLFAGCGLFVDALVQDLRRSPDLYGDLQGRADFLQARQAEADAWKQVRGALGRLLAMAHDNYLMAQADAIGGSLRVMEQVEVEYNEAVRREAPLEDLEVLDRRHRQIGAARVMLFTYRDACQQERRKAPARPIKEETPQQRRARLHRREQVRVELLREMKGVLDRAYARQIAGEGACAAPIDRSEQEGSLGQKEDADGP